MLIKDFFKKDWTVDYDKVLSIYEFKRLKDIKQSSIYHGEGDALTHTINVTKEMESYLSKSGEFKKGSKDYIMLVVAALCHDLGKAITTVWDDDKKDYTSPYHSINGDRITRNLLYDEDIKLREKVCYMVRKHMSLYHIFEDGEEKARKRLIALSYGLVPLKYMHILATCDTNGSISLSNVYDLTRLTLDKVKTECEKLNCFTKQYTDGTDLIPLFNDCKESRKRDKKFTVYILCGLPGSGKSTFADSFLGHIKNRISRDDIRCELGINGATVLNGKKTVGNKKEEDEVTRIFNARLRKCCDNRTSVVIDNTNLQAKWRRDIVKRVLPYNAKVIMVYVEAPSTILSRKRRSGEISKIVFQRMEKNFEFPLPTECHELWVYKQIIVEDGIVGRLKVLNIAKFGASKENVFIKYSRKVLKKLKNIFKIW